MDLKAEDGRRRTALRVEAAVIDDLRLRGKPLRLPQDAALPELAFLAEHRAKIFQTA